MSEFDDFCRTCMHQFANEAKEKEEYNIFQIENLANKLMQCTRLEVHPTDAYPHLICAKCYKMVLDFSEFQRMCRDSAASFKEIFSIGMPESSESPSLIHLATTTVVEALEEESIEKLSTESCDDISEGNDLDLDDTLNDPQLIQFSIVEDSFGDKNGIEYFLSPSIKKAKAVVKRIMKGGDAENLSSTNLKNSDESLNENLSEYNEDEIISDSDSELLNSESKTSTDFGVEYQTPKHQVHRRYLCTRKNSLSYLREHLKDHDGTKRIIYKGDRNKCGQSYKPKKRDVHVCEKCGAVLNSSRSLRDHRFIHIDRAEWPFVCDVGNCSKRFRILEQLKVHKKRHAGIKNYACPQCDMRFVTKPNMMNHLKHHTWKKTWPCEYCTEICKTPMALQAHTQNIHGKTANIDPAYDTEKNNRFECSFCDSAFFTIDGKKYHEMIHTGEKPYGCDECGKRYRHATGLKTHKRTHNRLDAKKDFVCSTCGHDFASLQTLKHHEMQHSGEKPYQCEDCEMSFRWPASLRLHEKRRHMKNLTEKDEKAKLQKWPCQQCPKVCTTLVNLRNHIKNKHSGSREFRCNYCDATFGTIEVWKNHEKRHTSEKTFVCDKCGKAFLWAYLLRDHHKTHMKKTDMEENSCIETYILKCSS